MQSQHNFLSFWITNEWSLVSDGLIEKIEAMNRSIMTLALPGYLVEKLRKASLLKIKVKRLLLSRLEAMQTQTTYEQTTVEKGRDWQSTDGPCQSAQLVAAASRDYSRRSVSSHRAICSAFQRSYFHRLHAFCIWVCIYLWHFWLLILDIRFAGTIRSRTATQP